MPITLELPHPRFNAQVVVQDDVLYIYGGTFEKGDREFTFAELHAIDLGKMDGVTEIYKTEVDKWLDSEGSDTGSDDEDTDVEDSEDEDEGGAAIVSENPTDEALKANDEVPSTANDPTEEPNEPEPVPASTTRLPLPILSQFTTKEISAR